MGPVEWPKYITTSSKDRTQGDKPIPSQKAQQLAAQQLAAERLSGEREGWVFHHAALSVTRWAMTDEITYTLPDYTEENPRFHRELLQAAISEAYFANWRRFLKARNKNQKDTDAGKPLSRTTRKPCENTYSYMYSDTNITYT